MEDEMKRVARRSYTEHYKQKAVRLTGLVDLPEAGRQRQGQCRSCKLLLDYRAHRPAHQAAGLLSCAKELAIVPRATHLFEEPGTLEQVARQTANWFERWFAA